MPFTLCLGAGRGSLIPGVLASAPPAPPYQLRTCLLEALGLRDTWAQGFLPGERAH